MVKVLKDWLMYQKNRPNRIIQLIQYKVKIKNWWELLIKI